MPRILVEELKYDSPRVNKELELIYLSASKVIWCENFNLWLLLGFSRSIGTKSIKSSRDAARVLDMKFIYGFVPKDESFSTKLDKQAITVAVAFANLYSSPY